MDERYETRFASSADFIIENLERKAQKAKKRKKIVGWLQENGKTMAACAGTLSFGACLYYMSSIIPHVLGYDAMNADVAANAASASMSFSKEQLHSMFEYAKGIIGAGVLSIGAGALGYYTAIGSLSAIIIRLGSATGNIEAYKTIRSSIKPFDNG